MRWASMTREARVAFIAAHPEMTFVQIADALETTKGAIAGMAFRRAPPRIVRLDRQTSLQAFEQAFEQASEHGLTANEYIRLAINTEREVREDAAAI